MTLNSMIYDINFFKEIENKDITYKIDENIKKAICDLIEKIDKTKFLNNIVNSDKYNKNTNTTKHNKSNFNTNKNEDNYEWRNNTKFKVTKIIDNTEGIQTQIINIRANLNKLTDTNSKEIENKIIEIIDELINNNTPTTELYTIGNIIFEIATKNKFYSKLYADLYSTLILKYNVMNDIFQKNYSNYLDIFKNIDIVDSNKDYDIFCKINKINEERKSLSLFLLNLTKNNIICKNDLFQIIIKLFNDILNMLQDSNKTKIIDEITENITILYDKDLFKDLIIEPIYEDKQSLYDKFVILSNSTPKEYKGLSLKTKFKYMSLVDK